MPRFRSPSRSQSVALTPETVRAVIADVMRPANFYAGEPLTLEWEGPTVGTIPWEVFRGRLLDPAFTRQRRTFEAWHVYQVEAGARSAEPVVSVKVDAVAGEVHVTRALYCYAWEGYDAGGNVYLSRATRKWVRELVGTVRLARLADAEELRDELACRLFQAVVGTSRLPLTSVEAPLPAFSLGHLAYCYRPTGTGSVRSWEELARLPAETDLAAVERPKLLETLLHATPRVDLGRMAEVFFGPAETPVALLQALFNEVSLSPYTDLADKTLALLEVLEERGRLSPAGRVDFLGWLLRQLARHLSAYDLVTFHQRGANYPDALLLDALLACYLDLAENRPELFADAPDVDQRERRTRRWRRRALRQACLLRTWYEGLSVPDAPTSQGEALRVLPEPHPRVPEEQILQPTRRQRRLFAGNPLADRLQGRSRTLLEQAVNDLDRPDELRELGMALFLDRPFGSGKEPTEPDGTLLLSYEAFSPGLADRRLEYLADKLQVLPAEALTRLRQQLHSELAVSGLPVDGLPVAARPGVVSLADARQAAPDFLLLRTTARSARDFLALYDFRLLRDRFGLAWLAPEQRLLLVGSGAPGGPVTVYDAELRPRLELVFDPSAGYSSRAGVAFPSSGLQVVRVWEDGPAPGALRERDLRGEGLVLRVGPSSGIG
jgi:hypothetical protein